MINERRLIRAEPSFGLTTKLFQISWTYVLLICALAGVGYAALYSAAGGSPDPYASKQAIRFAFGLVMMLCVALVDIRFIARLAWPFYAVSRGPAGRSCCAWAMSARAPSAGSSWAARSCSRPS